MPRRSLRPHLNQIRTWVRQGRTDAWVAHQLEVSVRDIDQFKRQNELVSDEESPEGALSSDYPEEIDLRAEDDALIAAELEAAEVESERARAEAAENGADPDERCDGRRQGILGLEHIGHFVVERLPVAGGDHVHQEPLGASVPKALDHLQDVEPTFVDRPRV